MNRKYSFFCVALALICLPGCWGCSEKPKTELKKSQEENARLRDQIVSLKDEMANLEKEKFRYDMKKEVDAVVMAEFTEKVKTFKEERVELVVLRKEKMMRELREEEERVLKVKFEAREAELKKREDALKLREEVAPKPPVKEPPKEEKKKESLKKILVDVDFSDLTNKELVEFMADSYVEYQRRAVKEYLAIGHPFRKEVVKDGYGLRPQAYTSPEASHLLRMFNQCSDNLRASFIRRWQNIQPLNPSKL